MSTYIAAEIRIQVREDSGNRCGYCLTSEAISGIALQFEHLWPESAGGETVRENLWLACSPCNSFKGDQRSAVDPETGDEVRLFNPRTDSWEEHFTWEENGSQITGTTPIGRATVEALKMNDALIVAARTLWVKWGVHPPG